LTAFNAAMVEFYFRNGPLRRKYDGLKYARKTVESVIFDLSLIPTAALDTTGEISSMMLIKYLHLHCRVSYS
jgi:hypothetical protein